MLVLLLLYFFDMGGGQLGRTRVGAAVDRYFSVYVFAGSLPFLELSRH